MKRKIGEIFKSEIYGKTYRVEKSTLSYPDKCQDCDFCTTKKIKHIGSKSCRGILDETGNCIPFLVEKSPVELIFKEVK